MTGDLLLRCNPATNVWYDAYDAFRLSLEDGALSTLMAYPPMKDCIKNESRLEHGATYTDTAPKVAEREFAIPVHIVAKTRENDFLGYYKQFQSFLRNGWIDMWVKALNPGHTQPTYDNVHNTTDIIFRCKFRSCTQFRQARLLAVFSLSLIEPNPTIENRLLKSSEVPVTVNQVYNQ